MPESVETEFLFWILKDFPFKVVASCCRHVVFLVYSRYLKSEDRLVWYFSSPTSSLPDHFMGALDLRRAWKFGGVSAVFESRSQESPHQ